MKIRILKELPHYRVGDILVVERDEYLAGSTIINLITMGWIEEVKINLNFRSEISKILLDYVNKNQSKLISRLIVKEIMKVLRKSFKYADKVPYQKRLFVLKNILESKFI